MTSAGATSNTNSEAGPQHHWHPSLHLEHVRSEDTFANVAVVPVVDTTLVGA